MSQALIVGAGLQRSRQIDQGLEGVFVNVIRKRWLTFLHTRQSKDPSLVIYDLTGVDTPQTDVLLELPARMPKSSVIYIAGADSSGLEGLSNALQQPNVDFILDTDDPHELRLRANRLLARGQGHKTAPDKKLSSPSPSSVLQHTIPYLHADNGRLDAREVSALFGISLAALARALGRSEQAVHKTPTAASIQPELNIYERVAAILLHLIGSDSGLRTWMQSSNPELENERPMTLLLNGEGKVIVDLLESVLHGDHA